MKKFYMFFAALLVAMTAMAADPDLYIRGAQFGWDAGDCTSSNKMTCSNGVYTITLDKLQSGFKIADNAWSTDNWGSASNIEPGKEYTLTNGSTSGNITTKGAVVITNAKLTFTRSTGVLKVEGTAPDATYPDGIYLVGDFNDWNEKDASYKLTRQSDTGKYKITGVTIASGQKIKFTNGSWSVNWGSETEGDAIPVGTAFTPHFNGNNYALGQALTNATVEFDYNLDDIETASVTITNNGSTTPSTGGSDVPDQLYVVGNVNGNDWSTSTAPAMTKDGSTYKLTGATLKGSAGTAYFTFITALGADWDTVNNAGDRYGAATKDEAITAGTAATIVKYPVNVSASGANSWAIADGTYDIVADFSTMKLTLTKSGTTPNPDPDPNTEVPDQLYIVGDVNGTDWSTSAAPAMTKDGNTYKLTGATLKGTAGTAYFSFITLTGIDWDTVNGSDRYGAATKDEAITAGTAATIVKYPVNVSASGANSWAIADGTYDIVADFSTMKLTLTKSGTTPNPDPDPNTEVPDQLYIVGDVNGTDWSTSAAPAMTKDGNTYKLTGATLKGTAGTAYFSFITLTGIDWDTVNGSDRYGAATKDEAITAGTAATIVKYPVNVSASGANSWGIADGTYDIVADFSTMKLTLTKSGTTPNPDPDPNTEMPSALYLVGDANDTGWSTPSPIAMTASGNTYKLSNVKLKGDTGSAYFSFVTISGSDWDTINTGDRYGASIEDEAIVSGTPSTMMKYEANLNASSSASWKALNAYYDVVADFSTMQVTITKVADIEDNTQMPDTFYIIGEINGNSWAPNVGVTMTKNASAGTFEAKELSISPTGYFSFCISLASTYDELNVAGNRYGWAEDEALVLGQASSAMSQINDPKAAYMASADASKRYDVVVNWSSKTVTVTEHSTDAVATIGDDSELPAEYYNLQGVRVYNPGEGIYIVRRGDKVTKQIIRK